MPTAQYHYTRQGLRSSMVQDPGTVGVRLQAEDPANVPETQRTEWVIAGARAQWLAPHRHRGLGRRRRRVRPPGRLQGRVDLPNAPIDPRRLGLAGAVCVSFSLAPGRAAAPPPSRWPGTSPIVQFRNPVDGTQWRKRYTQWYPGSYQGWAIARDLLADASRLERGIDAWWSPVADDPVYPLWLRGAALNELYYDVFGGVFWENGCITKPKRFGARPGQHLYFTLETDVFRDCESLDVRHYETRHLLELFPTIERDVLLGWADMVDADPLGRTPHDAGSPVDDPWFVVSQYSATRPGEPPLRVDWLDLPAKFVQQAHAYWTYTGDDAFGSEVYPALVRTMTHLLSLDLDGDGIPDAHGWCTTYDAIDHGWGGELRGRPLHRRLRGHGRLRLGLRHRRGPGQWTAAAAQARATAEAQLWVAERGLLPSRHGGPFGPALLADALCGQRYAARDGLPDVLDPRPDGVAPGQAYRLNVLGVASAQMGAANAVDPSGVPSTPSRAGRCGRGARTSPPRSCTPWARRPDAPTSSPTPSPPGTACTAPPTTTTGRRSGSTPRRCGSRPGTSRSRWCTGPPATSAAGRPGSCWWRSRIPFPPGWKPPG